MIVDRVAGRRHAVATEHDSHLWPTRAAFRRGTRPAAGLLIAVALLASGCSSDKHSSTAQSVQSSASPAATSAGGGPGDATTGSAPGAAAPSDGGTGSSASPHWQTPAITESKADTISQRLSQKLGLEFHKSDGRTNYPGALPPHTRWEAQKDMPEGYTFAVMIQADQDGNPRNVGCVARRSMSDQVAEALATCLDAVLDGKATDRQKKWISQQLATARDPQAQHAGPTSLVENSIVTALSPTTANTDLEIYRMPSS